MPRVNPVEKVCEGCGKKFHTKDIRVCFCGKGCGKKGDQSPHWKGDKVSIKVLHVWVANQLGRPDRCSKCDKIGKVDLANIGNKYNRDLANWEWLCRRCHMESDGRLKTFLSHSNMNNKIPDINCLKCGKSFTPKSVKRKFCSKSCACSYINSNIRDYSKRLKLLQK